MLVFQSESGGFEFNESIELSDGDEEYEELFSELDLLRMNTQAGRDGTRINTPTNDLDEFEDNGLDVLTSDKLSSNLAMSL